MASKKQGRPCVGDGPLDLDEPDLIFSDALKPSDRYGYVIKPLQKHRREKDWFGHGKVKVIVKDGKPV